MIVLAAVQETGWHLQHSGRASKTQACTKAASVRRGVAGTGFSA